MLSPQLKQRLDNYREQRQLKGGVVILLRGQIQGWCNCLRDPESWIIGCKAIDENGREWITVGGNDYDGAERWVSVKELENVHELYTRLGK